MAHNSALEIKLLAVIIVTVYSIDITVLSNFLIILCFLFGSGLLIVSAGAKIIITIVQSIAIINLYIHFIFTLNINNGKNIKSNIENIRQSKLSLA